MLIPNHGTERSISPVSEWMRLSVKCQVARSERMGWSPLSVSFVMGVKYMGVEYLRVSFSSFWSCQPRI